MSYKKITVKSSTKERIPKIKEIILKTDPKLKNMFLSEDYIINRVFDYYEK